MVVRLADCERSRGTAATGARDWGWTRPGSAMDEEGLDGIEVPLPFLGSSSDEEEARDNETVQAEEEDEVSGQIGLRVEEVLQAIIEGRDHDASRPLLTLSYWRELASAEGLHVLELAPDGSVREPVDSSEELRTSLQQRGYLEGATVFPGDEAAMLSRLTRGMRLLKHHGLAPTFIYVFDEAWLVLERCWRTLAEVLHADESDVVLEPSFFAHALSRPEEPSASARLSVEVARHTTLGGNFGLPHRDHSSSDCFDSEGRPVMLSVWCPLTPVSADNGCMHVLPQEFDTLLHRPEHPHHLTPWDQSSGKCRFPLGGTVALAPCEAGSVLAWYGSLVHRGGTCSRFSKTEPRASLTCTVRVRSARPTALQGLQAGELPQLTLDQLPLPLEARVRYACANVLLFKWWYGLSAGVLPTHLLGKSSPMP